MKTSTQLLTAQPLARPARPSRRRGGFDAPWPARLFWAVAAGWLLASPPQGTVLAGLPSANTHPAALTSLSEMVLRGMVHPGGAATAAWFEWGTTPALGNVTDVTNIPAADQVVWVTLPGGSLQPRQAYYCRLVASNSFGLTQGRLQMIGQGNVKVWGNTLVGQGKVPTSLSNAVAVAAGEYHNLALRRDGTVVAWGGNDYGPTNVPSGLSNVVAVAGGMSTVWHCAATAPSWRGGTTTMAKQMCRPA